MDEGDFDYPVTQIVAHNPKMYWVFAQAVRIVLLPIVLPVRFYESVMAMEVWERNTFIGMCLFIGVILASI